MIPPYPTATERDNDISTSKFRYWLRAETPVPTDGRSRVHLAALAYMSDAYFVAAAVPTHEKPGEVSGLKLTFGATLNHTVFFHTEVDGLATDSWMCSKREILWARGERSLVTQKIWPHEGVLVASCVHEIAGLEVGEAQC